MPELSDTQKFLAVRQWQENPLVHPLTCSRDGEELFPRLVKDRGVILICGKCGMTQTNIPEPVLKMYDGHTDPYKKVVDMLRSRG